MLNASPLDSLARRKQLLKAESALNRQALQLDCENVSSVARSTGRAAQPYSAVWKAGAVVVPLVGLALVRRGGAAVRLAKFALAGWQAWRMARRFIGGGRTKAR